MSRLDDMEIDEHGMKSDPLPHAVIEVSFGVDLLISMLKHPQGISVWNAWVKSMVPLLNPSYRDKYDDPPVVVSLDFTHGNLRGLSLDGIDLDAVWLEGVDFSSSSLQGGQIGFCPKAIFRGSNLSNVVINGDVSGVDFTGAKMEGVVIEEFCTYQKGSPPRGLSLELLARCKEVDDEPSEAAVSPVGRTIQVKGWMMLMRGRRGR